jgi:hypothetical protein
MSLIPPRENESNWSAKYVIAALLLLLGLFFWIMSTFFISREEFHVESIIWPIVRENSSNSTFSVTSSYWKYHSVGKATFDDEDYAKNIYLSISLKLLQLKYTRIDSFSSSNPMESSFEIFEKGRYKIRFSRQGTNIILETQQN